MQCVAASEQGERPHGADAALWTAAAAVGGGRCPPAESGPPSCGAWPKPGGRQPAGPLCTHSSTLCTSPSPSLPAFLPAVTTRVQRNKNMAKLQAGYLFPEVRLGVGSGPCISSCRGAEAGQGCRLVNTKHAWCRFQNLHTNLRRASFPSPHPRLLAGGRRTRRSTRMPRSSPWVRPWADTDRSGGSQLGAGMFGWPSRQQALLLATWNSLASGEMSPQCCLPLHSIRL